jgi:hypothetical protein
MCGPGARALAGWSTIGSRSIRPGYTDSNFSALSRGLPAIVHFFAQGENDNSESAEIDLDLWYQNVLVNSCQGNSVGPQDPLNHTSALAFIDTLLSFVARSRSLGWITDQRIADKYTNYFITVRSRLQQADTWDANKALQSVLAQANLDSSSALTSEAYALIRYNTEYLIAQLLPH